MLMVWTYVGVIQSTLDLPTLLVNVNMLPSQPSQHLQCLLSLVLAQVKAWRVGHHGHGQDQEGCDGRADNGQPVVVQWKSWTRGQSVDDYNQQCHPLSKR